MIQKKLFFFLGLLLFCSMHVQSMDSYKISVPEAYLGDWRTSYLSDLRVYHYFRFYRNSIKYYYGFPFILKDLTDIEPGYSYSGDEFKDNKYRVFLTNQSNVITYEFYLQKVYYNDNMILTFTINRNGKVEGWHDTDLTNVLVHFPYEIEVKGFLEVKDF